MACFIHIHQYCAALNNVEIAMRAASKNERDQNLMDSMNGGFDYMWNQAGSSCPMMPEILVNKGKALIMMERQPEAAATFQQALSLNQRYIPAYTALADLL
jgi:tetratricopeptide (TPR) repeat protein